MNIDSFIYEFIEKNRYDFILLSIGKFKIFKEENATKCESEMADLCKKKIRN